MDIICKQCQSKFKIQDEKIPPDKTVVLTCPKCKNKISVTGPPHKPPRAPADHEPENQTLDRYEDDFEEAYDEPFDFVEEEGATALICEMDPDVRKTCKESLVSLEYHVTEANNLRDALTKMRFHTYDLVVVNETFGVESAIENSILVYLQRLPMSVRRNIFVALLSDALRTMDNMMAYNRSVNLIINTKSMDDFYTILKRSMAENELFFKIFKETLKEEGRF
jgi:predicted Zn finger-like uncharacterized protein